MEKPTAAPDDAAARRARRPPRPAARGRPWPPRKRIAGTPETCSTTVEQRDAGPAARMAPGVTITGVSCALSSAARPVQDLDVVEPAEVGERLDVHALVELELARLDLASPGRSGCRAGRATRRVEERKPEVTTVCPTWSFGALLDVVEQQVVGVADLRLDDAGRRRRASPRPRRSSTRR